ncbi:hypothetical protein CEXT_500981 [Caerostris extrusa]|uniref:Uncharacterized protein n=1 Tax=Caerostris extrusa TaxID=172846 RepID=A0AAV4M9R2_CAEEX|nr:hypothetical protein CEXT_500981 [Caerostris extrusa]
MSSSSTAGEGNPFFGIFSQLPCEEVAGFLGCLTYVPGCFESPDSLGVRRNSPVCRSADRRRLGSLESIVSSISKVSPTVIPRGGERERGWGVGDDLKLLNSRSMPIPRSYRPTQRHAAQLASATKDPVPHGL